MRLFRTPHIILENDDQRTDSDHPSPRPLPPPVLVLTSPCEFIFRERVRLPPRQTTSHRVVTGRLKASGQLAVRPVFVQLAAVFRHLQRKETRGPRRNLSTQKPKASKFLWRHHCFHGDDPGHRSTPPLSCALDLSQVRPAGVSKIQNAARGSRRITKSSASSRFVNFIKFLRHTRVQTAASQPRSRRRRRSNVK